MTNKTSTRFYYCNEPLFQPGSAGVVDTLTGKVYVRSQRLMSGAQGYKREERMRRAVKRLNAWGA